MAVDVHSGVFLLLLFHLIIPPWPPSPISEGRASDAMGEASAYLSTCLALPTLIPRTLERGQSSFALLSFPCWVSPATGLPVSDVSPHTGS